MLWERTSLALCSHARPRGLWVQVAAGQEARLGAQGGAPVSRAIGTSHPLSSWEIRENVLVSRKPRHSKAMLSTTEASGGKGDAEYH